ncbi:MAG: MarR family transcriptional regulator [Clostridium sp.]|nr:MarR family transcriptional regulator [Clostridium sp.]
MGFKKHNSPPPKGMIGPRIMCLSRLMRQKFNEAAAEQGLFSGQQEIIFLLVENEGITLSKLAERLEVSTATASVSVKRMEKAGFIIKRQDEKDARITRLYPTEKAKKAPDKIRERMDALESTLNKGLTQEESERMTDMLDAAICSMLERSEDQ